MRILMTVDEAKALVKSRLSEKRYKHTINVKKMAVKLAKRYGADEEKAALAALLHDSAKELPKAEMLQIFADNAIIAKNAAKRPAPVWHGYAASVLCQTQWGVTDPEILSAIECHTTGKQNMSRTGLPRCGGAACRGNAEPGPGAVPCTGTKHCLCARKRQPTGPRYRCRTG